ncbi:MAG: transposase [Anaerolineae bacterium]|jgi:putative transposase|nr:transposase [Anaerolineae bacterium]
MTNMKPRRKNSLRLQGYDYSSIGAYFVTIVTWQREMLFGEIVDGEMVLNEMGKIVQKWWLEIPKHFPTVELEIFQIMPNHVHGIIIVTADGRGGVSPPNDDFQDNQGKETLPLHRVKPKLGQIIAYFKYQSTKELNALDGLGEITKFWQRNYHDRIIRNEREMPRIWDYIESNPTRWGDDDENPRNW